MVFDLISDVITRNREAKNIDISPIKVEEVSAIADEIKRLAFDLEYIPEYAKGSFHLRGVRGYLMDYIFDENSCCYIAKSKSGEFMGILMAYIYRPFVMNSDFLRAQDCLIQPCSKLSKKAKAIVFNKLVKKYEKWSEENKANEIFLGINVRNNITRSMSRKGYQVADYLLKKVVGGDTNG